MLAASRASASEYVSSPLERSVGNFFVPRVVGATTLGRSVICRTFQRYRIGFGLNAFLLIGTVEKWQQEIAKNRSAKNSTTKNSSLGTNAGLGNNK